MKSNNNIIPEEEFKDMNSSMVDHESIYFSKIEKSQIAD